MMVVGLTMDEDSSVEASYGVNGVYLATLCENAEVETTQTAIMWHNLCS
jgi:hypothetical protein